MNVGCREADAEPSENGSRATAQKSAGEEVCRQSLLKLSNHPVQGGDRPGALSLSQPRLSAESGPQPLHLEFLFCSFSGSEP